jgi:hypothetical protein
MKDATTIAVAQLNNAVKGLQIQTESQNEQLATGLKMAHEERMLEKDQAHQDLIHHEEMAHDVGLAAGGANTMTRTREGGQDHGSETAQEQSQDTSKETRHEQASEPQADGAGE